MVAAAVVSDVSTMNEVLTMNIAPANPHRQKKVEEELWTVEFRYVAFTACFRGYSGERSNNIVILDILMVVERDRSVRSVEI